MVLKVFFCWLPKYPPCSKIICFQSLISLLNLGYHFSSVEVWSSGTLKLSHIMYMNVHHVPLSRKVSSTEMFINPWFLMFWYFQPRFPPLQALVAAIAAAGSNACQGSWMLHQRRRRGFCWLESLCVLLVAIGCHLNVLEHSWHFLEMEN